MSDVITDLTRRITALESQIKGNKEYDVTVTNVDDPAKLGRIKAACPEIWGQGESPWIVAKAEYGGSGIGSVFTPRIDDIVSVRLRDGSPDAPEWSAGHRSDRSPIPTEFENPLINGIKTPSGTVMKYNDEEGSFSVENSAGGRVYIDGEGVVHIYGGHVMIHAATDINSDEAQHGVVTNSPYCICPFGWLHRGSTQVKASD